jgi:hypothetical protein
MELTKEEIELMEKMGLMKLLKPHKRSKLKVDKAPKTIDLSQHSGIVKTVCNCCLTVNERYIDYIRRDDSAGYHIKTVSEPTHPVTRTHTVEVTSCSHCADENLQNLNRNELCRMIINLRRHINGR